MKKLFYLFAALLISQSILAQNPLYQWAKHLGTYTSNTYALSHAVDADGNVYITGYFDGTADFNPGTGVSELTLAGNSDIFVCKLDASGSFVWAKSFGSTGIDKGNDIAVNASGVYVIGNYEGTVDFDPGAGVTNLSGNGIFVCKLDASGNLSWVKKFGNSDSEDGSGIALDGSGNVFITGEFFFTDDFDPGAGTANLTSAGQSDIFICKLDASGNYQWAKRFGGNNFDSANNIVTDASGGVYTTASFQATADFGAGSGISNLTSAGDYDFVICKLDNSGNYVWVKQIGGTGGDFGSGITVDASGNVYTTGGFSGTVDFDPGAGTANLTRQTVANGLFVTKLDIDGNYVWAQKIDGATISEGIIRSLAITSSSSGIYITGYLNGGMDVNPGPASNVLTSSSFSEDILIFKWDFEGNYLWAKAMGGSLTDHSYKISVSSGDIYINGTFQSLNVDFDPGLGTANLTKEPNPASTKTNGFIAKYTDCIPVSTPTGTITWTGSVGTAWNDACNWSPATVPGAGNAVVIPNTANDPIISSFTANVSRIDIQSGGQLTVSNTGILNVTQFTVTGIYLDGAALTNNGTINLTSNDDNVSEITLLSGSTVNNSGIINLNRGFGITNSSGATFTNNACGKVIFADASNNDFRNSGTVTNDGLIQIFWWLHNSGNITNNGVLKYETLNSTGGTLTNNRIIIDDDDSPIFQLGASNNATVNGIYTNQGASNSAGTYTQATNTFTPSGLLPGGTQTLYAKITPNGGACIYVVPFLYTNNIPLPVITSDPVSTSRCSGASASFSITATGAQSYRWQVSTNGGGAWANVPNSAPYSNVTSATLNISNVTGLNNNQYRCAAINLGGTVESNAATLTIISTTSAPTGTITWNGSVSTDWSTACNWTPASVPGTGNSVAIPDAANDPVIGANVTVLYVDIQTNAQLTVNSGASLTTTAGFDYGINLGNGSTFTNNGTTTVQESTNATAFFTTNATATINNNGTLTVGAAETAFSPFTGSSMTVNNTVNATITVNGTASGFSTLNTGTLQLTNHGSIIYNGPSRIFSGVKGSIVNNGLIRATSGTGVLLYAPSTLTNATCAQFILTTGDYFSDPGTTTTNNGYFYVAGQLYNNAFVNNGVLKYGSLSSTITNTAASAVIVNNSVPIFTYGGSYNGTVNGIFKDAAATLSAGTFTAPNTFVSSGLPGGAQTLYAKITPSGGSCNYVVPFTYIANANPTITAAAAVTRQQSSPGLLADIATVNDAETPAGSLTVTATTVPANITVTNITNVSGTIRATITANCFATIGANTLVLTVTDANGGIATTNFTVNVTANTPPTLTYNNAFLSQGAGGTILPATGPSDNEGAQVFLQSVSPSPSPATITVNNITGAVTIPNTIPVGIYTITVVATDVCTTDVAVPITLSVQSADYTITTTGGNVVITDVTGSGETLDITESSGNIRFNVTGKTYKIDGGVTTPFTTPADVPLSGKTSITVNTAVGNDIINVGTFSTQLPSLTVNGGTGDDAVNFNGDITFVTNANLDVDLQNDDAAPGSDAVSFAADANVILSGSGTATLKVSQNITFNSGSSLETVNGNLTLEANQQTTASTGSTGECRYSSDKWYGYPEHQGKKR